ncbi:hypothetical protein P7K49_001505 [Saguinus oedipus]|uniref:Uncharacterized protein n=1 Tax=Saguinus oedipus TaxID=9490 RepID=A0ABQ9WEN4_SAGOE|nr:hypothetical protein P7K49_001505 [Saguinus oedipus]
MRLGKEETQGILPTTLLPLKVNEAPPDKAPTIPRPDCGRPGRAKLARETALTEGSCRDALQTDPSPPSLIAAQAQLRPTGMSDASKLGIGTSPLSNNNQRGWGGKLRMNLKQFKTVGYE